jgi:hydrogenase maturation protease
MIPASIPTLILGIGNLVMTDDGVGVRVINHLQERYRFPENIDIIDGGTLGLEILPYLEGVQRLIIVDAVETGGSPGTLVRLSGDEINVAFRTMLSPHQVGLQDLLLVAGLQGFAPEEMCLLGVQPAEICMGTELTPAVLEQVENLVDGVLHELSTWGVTPELCAS